MLRAGMLLSVGLGFNGISEAYCLGQSKTQDKLRKAMLVNSGVYLALCWYLCQVYSVKGLLYASICSMFVRGLMSLQCAEVSIA